MDVIGTQEAAEEGLGAEQKPDLRCTLLRPRCLEHCLALSKYLSDE